jgi:hypothetical protein
MPEPIDFVEIAHQLMTEHVRGWMPDAEAAALQRHLAERLRHVWNRRGGADIATIDTVLSTLVDATLAEGYLAIVDRALRQLDR